MKIRTTILTVWLTLILVTISYLFWHNEWKYSLPTPVPAKYRAAEKGDTINLKNKLFAGSHKPSFIHFYNPECPCSKFNIPHVNSLVKKYGAKINFAIVVMNSNEKYTVEEIQDKFNPGIPVLFDKSMADSCGVYSTPQAVILDADHKLYYRGNYNKSRYCTDKNSYYAQMAIDSLLTNNLNPTFTKYALEAYGCALPLCTK